MKKAIYMRRSNDVQSDDRQRFICNPEWEIYSDQISAFRTSFFDLKRVEAKRLRDDIEAGKIDYVIITECSRLERRVDHYMKTIQWFRERKIQLKVLDLNVELFSEIDGEWQSDLNSAIVAFMSFYVAQRESMEKSFRTKLGVANSKKNGKLKIETERQDKARRLMQDKPWLSLKSVCDETGVCYRTAKKIRNEAFRN